MKKRLILLLVLIMVASLTFALVACSNDKGESEPDKVPENKPEEPEVEEHTHVYNDWFIVKMPTESEKGKISRKCTVCTKVFYAEIPEINADNYKINVLAKADCQRQAITEYVLKSDTIDVSFEIRGERLPHDYVAEVVAPTCNKVGYTLNTCSMCGKSYVDSEVPMLGHTYDSATHKCTKCGKFEPTYYTEGLVFTLNTTGDEYTVTSYSGNAVEVVVPEEYNGKKVTAIGDGVFTNHGEMESICLPYTLKAIGEFSFERCDRLKKVKVWDIEAYASLSYENFCFNPIYYAHDLYYNDELVKDLYLREGIKRVGKHAFDGCSMESLTIPTSLEVIEENAFSSAHKLEKITVARGNETFRSENNCVIDSNTSTLVVGCNGSIVSGDIEKIGDYAFLGSDIKSVYIPPNIKEIGFEAFAICNKLTNVSVSEYNKTYRAEKNCLIEKATDRLIFAALSENIPDSVKIIGADAFYANANLTNVTLGDNITAIEDRAFNWSTLSSITIGKNVRSIGANAFDCFMLNTISFNGTVAEWNAITKSENWYTLPIVRKVQCLDGEVAIGNSIN